MKLLSLLLFQWNNEKDVPPVKLAEAFELSDIGFFKRGSVKEVLTFVSRKVVDRSSSDERSSVSHEGYVAHVLVLPNKLACVAMTDKEFPGRVAFDVLKKAMAAFEEDVAAAAWQKATSDMANKVPALAALLKTYQNPAEVDKLMKLQGDVDEVKEIMMKNLDSLLERNEKLEDLTEKSADLSFQSKAFMKQSKKMNKCC